MAVIMSSPTLRCAARMLHNYFDRCMPGFKYTTLERLRPPNFKRGTHENAWRYLLDQGILLRRIPGDDVVLADEAFRKLLVASDNVGSLYRALRDEYGWEPKVEGPHASFAQRMRERRGEEV